MCSLEKYQYLKKSHADLITNIDFVKMHPCRSMECIWAKRRASGSSDAAWAVTAYQLMRGEVAGSLDSLLDICQWRHGQPYRTFKALVSEINRRLLFWKGVYIEIISRIYLTPQVFYFGLFYFKCIHAVVLPFPIDELLTFFRIWESPTPIHHEHGDAPIHTQHPSYCAIVRKQSFWCHDDVIKWKHFPRYWLFVRGIHRSFPSLRPVTRNFDVFFDRCLNKRLSKQSWGWWFETPSCSLWRHCNASRWLVNS